MLSQTEITLLMKNFLNNKNMFLQERKQDNISRKKIIFTSLRFRFCSVVDSNISALVSGGFGGAQVPTG